MPPPRKNRPLKAVDRPVVDERVELARAALILQRQGKSLWEIAHSLGLSQQQTSKYIRDALNDAQQLVDEASKRELLAMELQRLDALQDAHWGQATSGDVRSAEFILKVIDKRSRMLGLVTEDDNSAQTVQAVIVAGDNPEYIKALRAITQPKIIESADPSGADHG